MGSIALNTESKTGRCAFGRILDRHADTEDLEAVNDASIPHTDIWEATVEHYEPVGITTVKAHRNGKCACKRIA
ncbi:hypothetical protein D6T65_05050 [Arthrobacter frigidicola]|nr:hypothetical protein D6T65_05050 [Arthrobacter frigidicola]